jgi:hypothetical protein
VKIQGKDQLRGMVATDERGRRLGRVVAVGCGDDPYTAEWFALRLRGWRRRVRAVPAGCAHWSAHGSGGGVQVPYSQAQILTSPALSPEHVDDSDDLCDRADTAAYYATVCT